MLLDVAKRHCPNIQVLEGLETSEAAAVGARRKGYKVHIATIETADLPQEYYDLIIMQQVIEHVHNPRAVLAKLHSALRKGGRLVMETPHLNSWDHALFRRGYWEGYHIPRHFNLWTVEGMRTMVEQAGFNHFRFSQADQAGALDPQPAELVHRHSKAPCGHALLRPQKPVAADFLRPRRCSPARRVWKGIRCPVYRGQMMSARRGISFNAGIFLSRQFAIFVIVGIVATMAHWAYRYLADQFMPYAEALVLAYLLSLASGFLLTRYFVFPLSAKPIAHQVSYFVIFQLAMFPVVFGISYGLSEFVLNCFMTIAASRGLAHALAVATPRC